MIATKTTALLVALGLVAMAGTGAGLVPVYAQSIENEAEAENEDNDSVQLGIASNIGLVSSTECGSNAESENDRSVQVGSNQNIAANDCDSTPTQNAEQTPTITNTDNDVQVASADACQQTAALVGFNICW